MLGTVLDRITKLFGRAFFISAFFPAVLFITANVSVVGFYMGWDRASVWWAGVFENKALMGLLLLIAVTACAYLVLIVSPMLKRFLEGRYPLWKLGDWLRARQKKRFDKAADDLQKSLDEAERRRRVRDAVLAPLVAASKRRGGDGSGDRGLQPGSDAEFASLLNGLDRSLSDLRGPDHFDAKKVQGCADVIVCLYDRGVSLEPVGRLHRQLYQLLEDACKVSEQRYAETLMDFSSRFDRLTGTAGVRVTTLGNVMNAIWSYPYDRYCIDPTATWPQLQTVIPKEYFPTVEDARISYDFAVVCTCLSALLAASWACVIGWDIVGSLPDWRWPALAVSLAVFGGTFGTVVFRALSIEAARSFGAVFRTCFDLFRFELLKKLSLPLPPDLASERALWEKVNRLLVYGNWNQDLVYLHDGKPATPTSKSVRTSASRSRAATKPQQAGQTEAGLLGRILGRFGAA